MANGQSGFPRNLGDPVVSSVGSRPGDRVNNSRPRRCTRPPGSEPNEWTRRYRPRGGKRGVSRQTRPRETCRTHRGSSAGPRDSDGEPRGPRLGMANLSAEEPYALMRARTGLWEPWWATARATRPDARRGRILNEKGPTGNHASGFFFFPIGRQDGQRTFSGWDPGLGSRVSDGADDDKLRPPSKVASGLFPQRSAGYTPTRRPC
jgi:hypothetical protein